MNLTGEEIGLLHLALVSAIRTFKSLTERDEALEQQQEAWIQLEKKFSTYHRTIVKSSITQVRLS